MDTHTKKPIFKKWWVWVLAAIVLGSNSAHAQSLTREDAGPRYKVSDCLATIDSHEGWNYSATNGKWEESSSILLVDYGGLLSDFNSLKLYKASNGADTNYLVLTINHDGGYYDYPEINEGWHSTIDNDDYLISGCDASKESLLAATHAIDTAKAINFSPGVTIFSLAIFKKSTRMDQSLNALNADVNGMFNSTHYSFDTSSLVCAFFPVKLGENREVRFLIQQPRSYDSIIDKTVFDKAYFTVSEDSWKKFVASLYY